VERDPDLQRLVDQAARQRGADAARRAEEEASAARDRAAAEAARQAKQTVGLGLYAEIERQASVGMGWWLAMLLGLAALAHGWSGGVWPSFVAGAALVAAWSVRVAYRWLGLVAGLPAFRRFPRDVSFPVDGWDALLTPRIADDVEQWSTRCQIEIALAPGADEAVLTAAADLFVPRTRRWFYGEGGPIGGAASDLREAWRRDGLVLRGSANLWVVGDIYRFLRTLDRLHRRIGGVAGVTLGASGAIQVPRPSVD